MILTSEQIATLEYIWDTWYAGIPFECRGGPIRLSTGAVLPPNDREEVDAEDVAETLAAYAEIVQWVADLFDYEGQDSVQEWDTLNELWLAARRLRGLDANPD